MTGLIGAGQLESRLTAIGRPQQFLRSLALMVVREQKLLAPHKTRNLSHSIHIGEVSATRATVIASANYAAYTEYGTRAHDIRPVNAKALRFAVGANRRLSGKPRKGAPGIFTKRVRHPGTKGTHWAQRGAAAAVGKLNLAEMIVRIWNEAA